MRLIRATDRGRAAISMQVGDDVDALVERAVAAGWRLVEPAQDQPRGTRDAQLADADGNTVTLAGERLSPGG